MRAGSDGETNFRRFPMANSSTALTAGLAETAKVGIPASDTLHCAQLDDWC